MTACLSELFCFHSISLTNTKVFVKNETSLNSDLLSSFASQKHFSCFKDVSIFALENKTDFLASRSVSLTHAFQ